MVLASPLEGDGWAPAQVFAELGGIDGVAHVVPGAVGHIRDQVLCFALGTAQLGVQLAAHQADEVDVAPLVLSPDVVGLPVGAFRDDHLKGGSVVLDPKPVPNVHALSVNRQGFLLDGVADEEGDEPGNWKDP